MKIYSYVVRYDSGFAPNPFGKFCTLATCKPRIRKKIQPEDWIIGTGSVENVGNEKLIYAMQVEQKISFDEYWNDKRFQYKKVIWKSSNPIKRLGDNIYWKDENGIFHQKPSKHSNKDGTENKELLKHDLSGIYVLISKNFYYFGKSAINIPKDYQYIIKKGPGHKCNFTNDQVNKFINCLKSLSYEEGYQNEPFLIEKEVDICKKCIEYDGTLGDDE